MAYDFANAMKMIDFNTDQTPAIFTFNLRVGVQVLPVKVWAGIVFSVPYLLSLLTEGG